MFKGPELPLISLFVCATLVLVMRGPFGRALAERLTGSRMRGTEDREIQELRGEIDELRQQLAEVHERLDFAERLLARHEERALPRSGSEAAR